MVLDCLTRDKKKLSLTSGRLLVVTTDLKGDDALMVAIDIRARDTLYI